jgi:tRNA 2-thiocytidine biosynthesis protein TtcA
MLADGESVAVAVSGGADSLCLLHVLRSLNRAGRHGWDLRAVHVDPGFANWSSARVVGICRAMATECTVVQAEMASSASWTGRDSCHNCARTRRRALFSFCTEHGIRVLALAHNLDDVNETFLMNLLFTSSARTILATQPLFDGRLTIVRPLYYVDKDSVRHYVKSVGARPVRNPCPFAHAGSRAAVRRFLNRLYAQNSRVRTNLFAGLHNLKLEYLPKPRSTRAESHNQ